MSAPAELGPQVELAEPLARFRERGPGEPAAERLLTLDQRPYLRRPPGKPGGQLVGRRRLPVLVSEGQFLCNQFQGRVRVVGEFGVTRQLLVGERSVAGPPPGGQFLGRPLDGRLGRCWGH